MDVRSNFVNDGYSQPKPTFNMGPAMDPFIPIYKIRKERHACYMYVNAVIICINIGTIIATSCLSFYFWNELKTLRGEFEVTKVEVTDVSAAVKLSQQMQRQLPNQYENYNFNVKNDGLNNHEFQMKTVSSAAKSLLVAHFSGYSGEAYVQSKLTIGPWILDPKISTIDSDKALRLHDGSDSISDHLSYIRILEEGIYIIYAQIQYLSKQSCTYTIFAQQRGGEPRRLSVCSLGDIKSSELSVQRTCSIQTVAHLYKGDVLSLSQKEQNRTLWLESGRSYFGFVKISN